MAFTLTPKARLESEETNLTPNLVLEIDGVTKRYGAVEILKIVEIGDTDLLIGGFNIGEQVPISDQSDYVSFQQGTSTTISQTLNIDKGVGESISSMKVAVVDKSGEVTRDLLTPGALVADIMGRKAKIWIGFQKTTFPDDYITIFRGRITSADSSPGLVSFNINSPEDKKRSEIFIKGSTDLSSGMGSGDTVANVTDTSDFLEKVNGPDGTIDQGTGLTDSFRTYIRIDDEIMEYQTTSGAQFQSLTRGALGTVAATHSSGASVESFYRIGPDNIVDIALKLLFSGKEGPYLEDLSATNFVRVSPTETQSNTIFFSNKDLEFLYNISVGDYITTTGASNGANNVSLKAISGIDVNESGTILTISGVSFIEENDTSSVVDFRSQYDVWPSGAGIALDADEVDVDEHQLLKQRFLSSPEMDFYLKDTINGKEFLSEQVYNPVAAFSLPRKSQASIGYHSPPIPGTDIKILDASNVKNASKLKLSRSTNKNFFNTIITKFEEDSLEEEFLLAELRINTDSTSRIPIGTKPSIIESKGLRELLSGLNIAQQASDRKLNKYKFGAEHIKGMKINGKTGFNLEVGDVVIFDMGELKVSDIVTGTRSGEQRLFQVDNKSLNLRTLETKVDIVDTNFNKDARFGLISPSSFVGPGATDSSFTIKASYNTDRFGVNEGKKWEKYLGATINVRTADFATSDSAILDSVVGNKIFLDSSLSFTPSEDDIFELSLYTGQIDTIKLVFVFMKDTAFSDGPQYGQI